MHIASFIILFSMPLMIAMCFTNRFCEGRLTFHEMQVDKTPFPINTIVRPHQAEATKGKNVLVGEAKPDLREKELVRGITYETFDCKETFKVIVRASGHGGQGSSTRVI
jgi:hypothetical protein